MGSSKKPSFEKKFKKVYEENGRLLYKICDFSVINSSQISSYFKKMVIESILAAAPKF